MKYIRYLILLIVLLPLSTYALGEEVIIDCPEHIKKDEDFECEVTGTASYKVSAIEYEFSLPDYLTKKEFKVDSSWEGDEEKNLVILYTDLDKKSPFKIGVITLESSKDIDFVDIETKYLMFGDEDYNVHTIKEREDDVKDIDDNVKKTESKDEKKATKKNNVLIYVIIIIIVAVCILLFTPKKRRVRR